MAAKHLQQTSLKVEQGVDKLTTETERSNTEVMSLLEKYYVDLGKEGNGSRKLKCRLCEGENSTITGKPYANHYRHLKRAHPEQFKELQERRNLVKPCVQEPKKAIVRNPDAKQQETKNWMSNKNRYPRNHPKQQSFEKNLLNFVTTSCTLDITRNVSFVKLLRGLDKDIWIPSRRTLVRKLTVEFKFKALRALQLKLKDMPNSTCHMVLDLWTYRKQNSVIGVKVQFIDDNWKLCNRLVGFKEFNDQDPGANITKELNKLLQNFLQPCQVGSFTVDNTANIIAAFQGNPPEAIRAEHSMSDGDEEGSECESEDDLPMMIDELLETFKEENENLQQSSLLQTLHDCWDNVEYWKMSCCAHLIQLAINSCLESKTFVKGLVTRVNGIVGFFQSYPHWHTKLRSSTVNKIGLIKPCTKRWNAFYHCLKRIVGEEQIKDGFLTHLNNVLSEAKKQAQNNEKPPGSLTDEEVTNLKALLELLEPAAVFTEEIQSDGVTSSLIILSVIHVIERTMSCDLEVGVANEILEFKEALGKAFIERFSKKADDATATDSATGRKRRIATIDVFTNRAMILAALLDPRIKEVPFSVSLAAAPELYDKLCDQTDARQILLEAYVALYESSEDGNLFTSNDVLQPTPTPPKKKKRMSAFDIVEEVAAEEAAEKELQDKSRSEVDNYLQLQRIGRDLNPLLFWKENSTKFPHLASLARIYLGFPASSGSVERLFSVAGAIGRARRTRMNVGTMESLLFYKFMNESSV